MKLITALIFAVLLIGCTTNQPAETIFNGNYPSMKSIYEGDSLKSDNSDYGNNETGYSYARDQETELNQLFPQAKNPLLKVYVFPHLTDGYPVPGYMTSISLYEKAQNFLLPGEHTE